ncbi:VOC family protein [Hoyosella altamirensis]|uniref:VOC family protein n=1 Tax=Hoyosella altamirensis TaxID=616997 RepID=UPI0007DB632E|nr:VOC family protein [Hoyosella altamirensis]
MGTPKLDSMLLASSEPARLRDFYAKAFGVTAETSPDGGYQVLNFGGFYVLIDSRDDVGEKNPEPGRMILNFDVEDAQAVADQLTAAGAQWLAELEDREGSFFGTAIDPDGNYVQIIQLSEADRAAMS